MCINESPMATRAGGIVTLMHTSLHQGSYTDRARGATTCTQCEYDISNGFGPGYWSSKGAQTCDLCKEGYYKDPEDEKCHECPDHAKCVGNNKLPIPNKGYWIDRAEPKFSGTVMQCPRGEIACDGGIQRQTNKDCWSLSNFTSCSPDLSCTPGSTGPLCGACEQGFALNSLARTCDDCRQDSWQLFGPYAILAAVAALVVPLVFFTRNIIAKHEPMRMRKARETIFDLGQSFLSSVMCSINL